MTSAVQPRVKAKRRPSDAARLFHDVANFIARFVSCSDSQRLAITLWVFHTWTLEAAEASPYLAITSAERESGKSRLLEVLERLVRQPELQVSPTEAVIFRTLAEEPTPTLLLDEVDNLFSRDNPRREVVALLNAGNRKGVTVSRMGGPQRDRREKFPVFGAKAIAAIGSLPETVASRSINIRLQRKRHSEPLERFMPSSNPAIEAEAKALRRRLAKWAKATVASLKKAQPDVPDELSDRLAEAWWPLFAIAERLGCYFVTFSELWNGRPVAEVTREVAVELSLKAPEQRESLGIRLLQDISLYFAKRPKKRRVSSKRLARYLSGLSDSPWQNWNGGRGLSATALGRRLGEYGIKAQTYRLRNRDNKLVKGYLKSQFEDLFERYLSSSSYHSSRKVTK